MADNSLFDIFTAIKCEKQFGTSISFVRTVPQLQITHFIRISNESRQNIKANTHIHHTSTYIKPNHIKYDFPVWSQKYIFIGSYIKNHENDFSNQTKFYLSSIVNDVKRWKLSWSWNWMLENKIWNTVIKSIVNAGSKMLCKYKYLTFYIVHYGRHWPLFKRVNGNREKSDPNESASPIRSPFTTLYRYRHHNRHRHQVACSFARLLSSLNSMRIVYG